MLRVVYPAVLAVRSLRISGLGRSQASVLVTAITRGSDYLVPADAPVPLM